MDDTDLARRNLRRIVLPPPRCGKCGVRSAVVQLRAGAESAGPEGRVCALCADWVMMLLGHGEVDRGAMTAAQAEAGWRSWLESGERLEFYAAQAELGEYHADAAPPDQTTLEDLRRIVPAPPR